MDFCKELNVLIVGKLFGLTAASANIIRNNFEKYGGKAELYDFGTGGKKEGYHIIN